MAGARASTPLPERVRRRLNVPISPLCGREKDANIAESHTRIAAHACMHGPQVGFVPRHSRHSRNTRERRVVQSEKRKQLLGKRVARSEMNRSQKTRQQQLGWLLVEAKNFLALRAKIWPVRFAQRFAHDLGLY